MKTRIIKLMVVIIDWLLVKLGYEILDDKSRSYSKRRELKDVKRNDMISVEHPDMLYPPGKCLCVSNDPKTKKIVIRINWREQGTGRSLGMKNYIMNYSDKTFENFHLLNVVDIPANTKPGKSLAEDSNNLGDLQKRMNEALDKEDYETADKLQKQIDKLMKK